MAKRGGGLSNKARARLEEYEEYAATRTAAAAQRVLMLHREFSGGDAIGRIASLCKRVDRFAKVRDLFDELEVIQTTYKGEAVGQVVRLAILRFLNRFIDGSGLYPAEFYRDNYGIPPARIRQRVRRRQLKAHKIGAATFYAFAEVRSLWPQDVTFETERGVTKRDRRDEA